MHVARESEDDKEVDVGDCLEESESESEFEPESETATEAATLDHISEDDDKLIEVRKSNIEIKYKKKKSGTKEVDQVPDEPHEEASEAAIEQASDVANELPNEMDTGGVGDDESDYATSDDYLSPESSEEEDEDVVSVKERKRNLKVKKRMYPIFNPNVEMSNIQIELGMRLFVRLFEGYHFVRLFLSQVVCQVRKRGKEVAVEKPWTKNGTTKKGKETVQSGTTEVRRENKAPSSNVGEGTLTVSKRGKRAADDVPQGVSKRKTGVKGRKDHVPEGVGVFTADSGNSYLKMSATGAPILINEAKISEANNKRKGRPPLPRRSSKAPVIGLQSNQVSSEAQVPSSQGSISASKQVSTTASKQSLTTASAQASATASKQSLTTDAVASSSKPKTRSAAALETQHQETHHQAVASRNSQSLTTDVVASSSKTRNSPSKTKQKTATLTVRTRANSKPKTRSAAAKAKTKVWK
ncbi:hypothetical protein IFM89_036420 [Coptis chinensis]|uniref:Uncharacterized protein n=1 Tax=Coptis chinensis TaxID=261450 RepID=A0A835IHV1_9MAGN|nr:hypothetical protein IFM89_036420 [Coptis chinensis]